MGNTPADVIARSRQTTVIIMNKVKRIYDDGLETVVFQAKGRAHTEVIYYELTIEMFPTEIHKDVYQSPGENNPAWVQCSCPFFLFNCEYALARVGSSEIKFSNGKAPLITNQRMVPYFCKHLYKAAPLVLKEAQRLAKTDKRYEYT